MTAPSDGRRQRSQRTRVLVVEAARDLFVEDGYVATTIEAVAARAGVAGQTVYYAFGTKPALLSAVLDASIAGDVEPVPIVERPWVDVLGSVDDARHALEHLMDASVAIVARVAPIYEVVRRAAADGEVGALLAENRRRRRDDQRRLIEILAESRHLRVDVDTATDIFYGVVNEEVFQLLTTDCGWDVERFRTWVTSLMAEQLLSE